MRYVLDVPKSVGMTLDNQISIEELEVVSVAFNFDWVQADHGKATISVVLKHEPSGWAHNIVYTNDESALVFWRDLEGKHGLLRQVLEKLAGDGRLPPGKILPAKPRQPKPASAQPIITIAQAMEKERNGN